MKSTDIKLCGDNILGRLKKWARLCGLLTLTPVLFQPALAVDDLYQNDAIVTYPGTEANPPFIDAINFVNNGTFIMNFTAFYYSYSQPFYETSDTLNYSNTGLMMGNLGFQFNNRSSVTGLRSMSSSFVNQGMISCGSTNDVTDPFGGFLYLFGYYPQCVISASNIVNSGNIDMGTYGMVDMKGRDVDLNRATFRYESVPAYAIGSGWFDLNTNFWDPSLFLGPGSAESAFFPIPPYYLTLTNSLSYFDFASPSPSNNIIRAVFIQNNSETNVSYNVYFDTAGLGFGGGNVTIEWAGSYLDPATGLMRTNYLYLNDNYIRGTAMNLFLNNGIPDNFQITESTNKILLGAVPTTAGFYNVFSAGTITNRYSVFNAQLISTSVPTNALPNYAVTNLPSRLLVSASDRLEMSDAHITGLNYMSLASTNQFDGSAGALIEVPFSDLKLSVTNGFLTISNLLAARMPYWSGNLQAWSTRWVEVVSGVTNDYRVIIVGSQLDPTSEPQVQDLVLHGTNTMTISDKLNIIRKFTADAENLTLTTNETSVGATSFAGELNINSSAIYWGNSMPNLRNLTNSGFIRFQNLAQFAGVSNGTVVVPATGQTTASAELHEVLLGRKNLENKSTVQVGTNVYTFVKFLKKKVPNQVKIARTFDGTMNNLIAAINGASGAGKLYSPVTLPNPLVTAGVLTGPVTNRFFTVTAKIAGDYGNAIVARTTSANLIWQNVAGYSNWTTLAGGAEPMPATTNAASVLVPYKNFINRGLVSGQGTIIWTTNFFHSGMISNGLNASFSLDTVAAVMTNASILAGGDVTIDSGSVLASNVVIQAARSLVISATNLLDDGGATNGSIWVVQSPDGTGGNGLIQRIKPAIGDLLGTTITNYAAAPNKLTANIWAGQDRGVSNTGYTNNSAVGRLILDAGGSSSKFRFTGAGVSNALYVDYLELRGTLTNGVNNSYDFGANLAIDSNIVIYFAEAVANDVSIAAKVDEASRSGRNGGRLRWVPTYAGNFSSETIIYPDGTTNVFNSALAESTALDSNGNGINNASDPAPFFTSSQVNLVLGVTNAPPLTAVIQWNSIPGATNYVRYSTNMSPVAVQFNLTNFVSPSLVPPAGGWPITNTVYDVINPMLPVRYYNVEVSPNSTMLYGP